jgi:hypothetical protein
MKDLGIEVVPATGGLPPVQTAPIVRPLTFPEDEDEDE